MPATFRRCRHIPGLRCVGYQASTFSQCVDRFEHLRECRRDNRKAPTYMTKTNQKIELAGGNSVSIPLNSGQRLRLINTYGSQVVDTWAICADVNSEYLSVEHTRRMTGHVHPIAGDMMWSNRRRKMLLLEEDTFPGTHDTIVACCDHWLYEYYGCPPGHKNCHDNYLTALDRLGVRQDFVPNPLNLWMNVPIDGNSVSITEPLCRPGDYVTFRAERDIILVFSACPMDVAPSGVVAAINGPDCKPQPVHYELLA